MPSSDSNNPALFDGKRAEQEKLIRSFDEAWQRGEMPEIIEYLPNSDDDRGAVLCELVHIDIERRLKSGEEVRAESYFKRYPELEDHADTATQLIGTEFQFRRRREPALGLGEFEQRFPQYIEQLSTVIGSQTKQHSSQQSDTARDLALNDDTHSYRSVSGGQQSETPGTEAPAALRMRDYRILEQVGQGGMGTVYKALHERLGKEVALKVLPESLTCDPQALARFQREMQVVGGLDHPNVVRATDAGEIDGRYYLSTDFIEGLDLAKLADQCGPLNVADACELVRQAAVGLQHIHEHQLVHRDIKPSNLMLSKEETVKVLDLGLARLQEHPNADAELTTTGQLMGTFDYMAPEQTGLSHLVDIRADIYSLGATLYKLLTGRAPFASADNDTPAKKIASVVRDPVPSLRQAHPGAADELIEVVDRMLAKDPDDRFATPQEAADSLARFTGGNNLKRLLEQSRGLEATPGSFDRNEAASEDGDVIASLAPKRVIEAAAPSTSQKRIGLRSRHVRIAAVALALAGCITGAVIAIRVVTDNGELLIENYEPSLQVLIKQNGNNIKQWELQKGNNATTLRSGEYTIELIGPQDGIEISQNKITVTRGGRVLAMVSRRAREDPNENDRKALSVAAAIRRLAIVNQPAKLDGVRSWTIVPRTPQDLPTSYAFHPDGRLLALGGHDGHIRIYDIETKQLVRILVGHVDPVVTMSWSSDGSWLASGSFRGVWGFRSGTTKIWELAKGRLALTQPSWSKSLVWVVDGERLLLGKDTEIHVLDIGKNRIIKTLTTLQIPGMYHRSVGMSLSPDRKTLAMPHRRKGRVSLINMQTFKESSVLDIPDATNVSRVSWSPDGKRLAVTVDSENGHLAIWKKGAEPEWRYFDALDSGTWAVSWSADGRLVAAGGDHGVQLWDADTGHRAASLPGSHRTSTWNPKSTLLAYERNRREVVLFDVATKKVESLVQCQNRLAKSVSVSATGKFAAVGYHGGSIALWDLTKGRMIRWLTNLQDVRYTVFSPDERLLSGTVRDGVKIWEASTGKLERSVGGPGTVFLSWSPDAMKMVVRERGKLSVKHLVTDGKPVSLDGGGNSVVWSPDSRRLVGFGKDKTIVWAADSGRKIQELDQKVESVQWTARGKILIGKGSGTVTIWDIASGDALGTVKTPADGIAVAALSADGTRIAVAEKGLISIREVETNEVLKEVAGTDFDVNRLRWSPDAKLLASSADDQVLRVHDVSTGDAIAFRGDKHPDRKSRKLLAWFAERRIAYREGSDIIVWDVDANSIVRRQYFPEQGFVRTPDAMHFALADGPMLRVWGIRSERPLGTYVALKTDPVIATITVTPDGHYRAQGPVHDAIIYAVETETGQQTLTAEQFADEYGWSN